MGPRLYHGVERGDERGINGKREGIISGNGNVHVFHFFIATLTLLSFQ